MDADLLCYAALGVNLAAMSRSSQTSLRLLSLLANFLLSLYATVIGASALIVAACAVMAIHLFHLFRIHQQAGKNA